VPGVVLGVTPGACKCTHLALRLPMTIKLAATNVVYGTLLLMAYGVGHCAVIVAAGTSTELVQKLLDWNEQSKGLTILKIVCGVLVMLGGVWLVYTAP
jgi:cytochrome c-type biogenesis protein